LQKLFIFDYILLITGVFFRVAFFTLIERKVLGLSHFRKGPRKLFFFGVFQPISDALKLFSKEHFKGTKTSFLLFFFSPFLGLLLIILLWRVYSSFFGEIVSFYSLIYIFCLISLRVYIFLFCGWSSNRKYSLIGRYRSISQTISYEISMIFFGLFLIFLVSSYDLRNFSFFQHNYWFLNILPIFFFGWIFIILAESNRTPFDFSESESELVSGFNVEFGGGGFSLIFIYEYGIIIFLGFLTTCLFLGNNSFMLKIMFLCFMFVWIRCCFPRFRYDLLIMLSWKIILPFSLFFLLVRIVFL
jgi:NADH-ubiquinone oxidoreductase chain 1